MKDYLVYCPEWGEEKEDAVEVRAYDPSQAASNYVRDADEFDSYNAALSGDTLEVYVYDHEHEWRVSVSASHNCYYIPVSTTNVY